ncbi:short chain dehydrogenase [Marinobacterium nitratireducens]|uniref:Short chain dehydrogenase n=1 Tax=Marinobacterium nitratireducens TaxID=518897 RepID=A0A917ZNC2_9GAMM|nr:SDR family oxidoreductase [Marinobacterium nitratireducens]GGO86756.1 short chain dehydrogenase [Marinobacterium nitratireducens]
MKRILLTGASGGIGRAIAVRLANDGHRLILVARDARRLEEQLSLLPGSHEILTQDLAAPDAGIRLVEALGERVPDVLINCAGVQELQRFDNSDWLAIERLMRINLLAPMAIIHALVPRLHPGSQIINIGSVLGEIGYPGYVAYGASKGGLKRFSEALGRELRDTGIRVSWLAPRATDTALNSPEAVELNRALGNRVDAPSVVADAVAGLIQSPRTSKVLGFPESLFTRINALMPRLVDGAIGKQLDTIKAHCKEKS